MDGDGDVWMMDLDEGVVGSFFISSFLTYPPFSKI